MKKKEESDFIVKFEYPAEQDAFYDPTTKETFFFGKEHTAESLIEGLKHEILHFLIHKFVGKRAALKFDKLCDKDKVKKWDEKAYRLLY